MMAQLSTPRVQALRVERLPEILKPGAVDVVLAALDHLDDAELQDVISCCDGIPVVVLVHADAVARGEAAVQAGVVDFLIVDEMDRRVLSSTLRHVAQQRHALALQHVQDGLWDWNLGTGRVYFSARFRALLGDSQVPASGTLETWLSRVHGDDVEALREGLQAQARGDTARLDAEHRIVGADGSETWLLCRGLAVRGPDDTLQRVVGTCTDVTRRRQEHDALRQQALHDALTGLPNRAAFQVQLQAALTRLHGDGRWGFAVLFIDLDRFKVINDGAGHLAGDALLAETAARLLRAVRAQDLVARFGGDEFVVLLHDVHDAADAMLAASRIQRALGDPVMLGGHRVFTTASIGVALADAGYRRPDELIRDSDAAMYRAKALGRGRNVLFSPDMRAEALMRFQLENDVWRGIERGEFVLHYQPVISLRSGELTGLEALLRWNHPEQGLLAPGSFLPAVEECGLMVRLGEWVLREACRQLRAWRDAGHPGLLVTVNLSTSQLASGGVVELIAQVLAEHALRTPSLLVDITEAMISSSAQDAVVDALHALHAAGVQLCLDDFGRGYSSLTQLHGLPLSVVKLDPLIVQQTGVGPQTSSLVRAVVELAEALGVQVLAEGVERQEQLDELINLNVDGALGTLFSAAVPADDVEKMLKQKGWIGRWQRVQTILRANSSPRINIAQMKAEQDGGGSAKA